MVVRRFWVVCVISIAAGVVWAGRPLVIDDADPVGTGEAEIEAGVAYQGVPDCRHWDYPVGIAVGLVPGVEAGMGFGGQFEQREDVLGEPGAGGDHSTHGVGDLMAGAKWQFTGECPLGARHALAPSVKLPTADEDKGLGSGEADYDLTWIASRSVGEKAAIHLNAGYSWIGGPAEDVLHGGLAVDIQLTPSLQWVGETYVEKESDPGAESAAMVNTGVRWAFSEAITFDAAAGTKLCGDEAPDFIGTAGVTWLIGGG
jgi:hypothetical protein